MSAISPDAQRALTEKRGKELDRWVEMKCIRFMSGIEPFSPTLSDLPSEIIHHVVEKMEPVEVITSRELCRNIRKVVNKFVLRFGGIPLFLKKDTVSEQVSPTFTGMPTKIINQVVEKMNPIERLRARKVCRSLRTAVDKFGLRFDYIRLSLMEDIVRIELDKMEITYTSAANDSTNVIRNGQKTIIAEENFVERAAKDLKILWKHAQNIEIQNYTKDRHATVTTFAEILKFEKNIIVKEIKLYQLPFDEVLTFLPCFKAKVLKKIKLIWTNSNDEFEQITHLEQWKNAEELELWDHKIASTMIFHWFHFKFFSIYHMDDFSAQTAIQMRDDLLRRSTFESCCIEFEKSKINPIEIAKVFEPDYVGGSEFNFEYSNGNDKFDIMHKYWKTNSNFFRLNVKRL